MSAQLKSIAVSDANSAICSVGLHSSWRDLQDVIAILTDADYTTKPAPNLSSIGAHMRHMIECYQMLAQGIGEQYVDYSARARNVRLETDRTFATEQLAIAMESLLTQLEHYGTDLPLTVVATPAVGIDGVATSSSLGREVGLVLQHSEHHLASIVIYGQVMGINFPPDLGKAVATIEYERRLVAKTAIGGPHV